MHDCFAGASIFIEEWKIEKNKKYYCETKKYWNLECSSKIIWFLLLLAVLFWVKVELPPCFYQILPWLFPQTILFIIVFKIKEYKTGLFYCYVMYECSNSLTPQILTSPPSPVLPPFGKKTVSQLLYITIDLKQHHESSRIIIHGLSTS